MFSYEVSSTQDTNSTHTPISWYQVTSNWSHATKAKTLVASPSIIEFTLVGNVAKTYSVWVSKMGRVVILLSPKSRLNLTALFKRQECKRKMSLEYASRPSGLWSTSLLASISQILWHDLHILIIHSVLNTTPYYKNIMCCDQENIYMTIIGDKIISCFRWNYYWEHYESLNDFISFIWCDCSKSYNLFESSCYLFTYHSHYVHFSRVG